MNFITKVFSFLIISFVCLWMIFIVTKSTASPPACFRNDASMFINSETVIEAEVIKSRRWSKGSTIYLVAKYKVIDVFKGDVGNDEILIVTDSCLDQPVPREFLGYPKVEEYCRGEIGLNLTGVNAKDGSPIIKSEIKPSWILFLRKDIRRGAPQLTWLEVSRTSFYGGCDQTRNDIPPDERKQFDRLCQRLEAIGDDDKQTDIP